MFIINASPKNLKIVTKILQDKGFIVRETKFPDYIAVPMSGDPRKHLPEELREHVVVKPIVEGYHDIIQSAGVLREMLAPETFESGDAVRIIDGPYGGFTGIIQDVRSEELFMVQLSVFGKMTSALVERKDMRKLQLK